VAKVEAEQQEQAKVEAATEAWREEERKRQVRAEMQRQAEVDTKAAVKREKEKLRSALKKARKELKTLAESGKWVSRATEIEVLAAMLSVEQLQALHTSLVEATDDRTFAAMEAKITADVTRLMAQ